MDTHTILKTRPFRKKQSQEMNTIQKIALFVVIIVCLLLGLIGGFTFFYSALFGVLVAIIPQFFFAQRVFRSQGARQARAIVYNLYIGEIIKIAMTVTGFMMVFSLVHSLNTTVFFSMFIVGQFFHWCYR